MSIWTVTNLKPGTAKTTSAVWLAHSLHERGHKVLLVGADPGGANLKLAPAFSDGMGSAERWNARAPMPFDVISLATRDLHRTLPRLAADYAYAVVDSPPIEDHQGIAVSALRAADVAVIPVAPTTVEVDRMAPVLHVVGEVNALRQADLAMCVLLNRCVANAASTGEAEDALTAQGYHVLQARIPRLELYAQSSGAPVLARGTAYDGATGEILEFEAKAA
ncbi:ParA family protein [Nonomuraea sp. WAC 01424]|uniref:ParA family protein n=1 Tax=Nonomuraea sp. WAC 01424 TaxID=2203200 RepID=UPI00163B664E|nr:ParA family protein [Nonomuraea sp. WAC 01424]